MAARLKSGTGKNNFIGLFALSGPVLLFLIFLLAGERLLFGHWSGGVVSLAAGALALWGFLLVDVNNLSPRAYYRDRLCDCYLAAPGIPQRGLSGASSVNVFHGRTKDDAAHAEVRPLDQWALSKLNQTGAAPYHLINTTVNLPASREPNLRGRASDFFMFSRDFCGGPICGYFSTPGRAGEARPARRYRHRDGDLRRGGLGEHGRENPLRVSLPARAAEHPPRLLAAPLREALRAGGDSPA